MRAGRRALLAPPRRVRWLPQLVVALMLAAAGLLSLAQMPMPTPTVFAQGAATCPAPLVLGNGDFETPVNTTPVQMYVPGDIPAWQTTDSNGVIEIWNGQGPSPDTSTNGVTITPYSGNQYAEINAYSSGQLYQDLDTSTLQGKTLTWTFAHRGRAGADTMGLYIGAPDAEDEIIVVTTDNTAWMVYSGSYVVPDGQTTTRFAYRAISTASGSPAAGNFVDGIAFGTPPCAPELTLEKTSDVVPGTELAAGDEITYTFTATNTGNVDIDNVAVTDELPGLSTITPASANILEGESAAFTATYTVTQADLDAGQIVNTASVAGDSPLGYTGDPPAATDELTVELQQNAGLTMTKEADTAGPVGVGETITYTFTVENTGNVTISDVTISDPLPGLTWVTGPNLGTLTPGQSATGTATYTVTQADIDAGGVTNSATVTGTPPASCADCDPTSPPSEITVPGEEAAPALTLAKEADTAGPVGVGETITYTFTATNTGNVTISDVTVTDALPGLTWVTGPTLGTLAPGASVTGTATYVVTEADLVAGGVANSATVTGMPPAACPECDPTSPPSAVEVPTEDPAPALTLTKTADTEGPVNVGETITYTLTATNTGNVTLTDVTITDALPGLTWVTGPNLGTLTPGQSATGTATYTVTQADIDAGGVANSATVTGTPPAGCTECGTPVSPPAESSVPGVDRVQDLEFAKVADTEGPVQVGDEITYTFTATNTGNVTLSAVTISDPLPGLTWVTGPDLGTLTPGQSATGTATYTVTQADIDAGGVTNSATATGTPPGELLPPTTPPSGVTVPGEDPVPALTLAKEADTAGPVGVGETITYTFTATNTGNVTISDVTVTDALPGLTWVTGPTLGTLAPGASATGTATYVVTEADLVAGGVANSATVTGMPPAACPECDPTSPPSAVEVPTEDPAPGLTLSKTADPDGGVVVGDTITYTFTVTNTGNVTLTDVTITDALPGLTWVTGPNLGTIGPDESATGTATYVVSQADIDAGGVANSATVTGTSPSGEPPVSPPAGVFVSTTQTTVGLSLEKIAAPNTTVVAGDTMTFTFVVTNLGTTTITNVTVVDPMVGLSAIEGPHGINLGPGESATFTASYVVTEADVVASVVANSATASGTGPSGESYSTVDSVQVRACEVAPPSEPVAEVVIETAPDDPAETGRRRDRGDGSGGVTGQATPIVITPIPVTPEPQPTEELVECAPLPEPAEPTPMPAQPANPGGGTSGGGAAGGGTTGGGSAPVITDLPNTGQGVAEDASVSRSVLLGGLATGVLLLALVGLSVRRRRGA